MTENAKPRFTRCPDIPMESPAIPSDGYLNKSRPFFLSLLLLSLMLPMTACGPSRVQIAQSDVETLKDTWLKSYSFQTRQAVVAELENRKAVDALTACLLQANSLLSVKRHARGAYRNPFSEDDIIVIVEALGRLKNPLAVGDLASTGLQPEENIQVAVLKAFKEINHPKAALPARSFLQSPSADVRWQALDTVGHLRDKGAAESIYPLLFDDDQNIRWKAVHALGQIGNPDAVNRLSLLLADPDPAVRSLTENVLKDDLHVPVATLQSWKEHATEFADRRLSLEGLQRSSLEYQKTLAESEALKKMVGSEVAPSGSPAESTIVAAPTGTPPLVLIGQPMDGLNTESRYIRVIGEAVDDTGVQRINIYHNDRPVEFPNQRGIQLTQSSPPRRLDFDRRIALEKGGNRIRIQVVDVDGLSTEKTLFVHRAEKRLNVWAVVVGINDYPQVRPLKYAVSDAQAFYDWLVGVNGVPGANVTLLLDAQATLKNLRSALGTQLKNAAAAEDMVVIFFAGHGAVERDVLSPDGDGLEKYLLAHDTDPKDLYATALPMREVAHVFDRIRSERLIFLADACYSGASGGRTISAGSLRATLSEAFLDRLAGGKGKIIISASGANEVSAEKDELQHGVFTYYLLEGLRGAADSDRDGIVTVDEAYRYVSEAVPRATGQEQHPVKKGTVEGQLLLGVVAEPQ